MKTIWEIDPSLNFLFLFLKPSLTANTVHILILFSFHLQVFLTLYNARVRRRSSMGQKLNRVGKFAAFQNLSSFFVWMSSLRMFVDLGLGKPSLKKTRSNLESFQPQKL